MAVIVNFCWLLVFFVLLKRMCSLSLSLWMSITQNISLSKSQEILGSLSLSMPNMNPDLFSFIRMFDSAKALAFNNVPTREEVWVSR